ncbi:MAG TPA: RsmE family RNA methyltransferase [Chlamydiales bacterium]|nr:RsmE family RNA methyltransferase [Chlamydiales bacterium]
MPAERFYLNAEFHLGDTLPLEGQELHHLAHVMRIRPGEEVQLLNGRSALATAKVTSIEKRQATLEILAVHQEKPPAAPVTLAIPYMRMAKLEWIIEKGTELGAAAFLLYPADHSEKETFSSHQLERLHFIAISAMKQCGRLDLPSIQPTSFNQLLTFPKILFGDPAGDPLNHPAPPLLFITGPEKGFSPKELTLLKQKAQGVRLHKNILRAETAPIVAIALFSK